MDLGLTGRVALVCASSRGLGRAVADALASEGCRLMICARGEADLERAAEELRATGAEVGALAVDLGNPEEVTRLVRATEEAFGSVDVLVTNTGGPPAGPFESHSAEAWSSAVRQNLDSVVGLCREVMPGMKDRGFGRILNVTSIAVKQPVDGLILSNSVRAAVTGFARTLANEVASHGITVNNVLPGFTRTERLVALAERTAGSEGITTDEVLARWEDQIPAGRVGEPSEFAAAVAFLASTRASYITGVSLTVDGGWVRALY